MRVAMVSKVANDSVSVSGQEHPHGQTHPCVYTRAQPSSSQSHPVRISACTSARTHARTRMHAGMGARVHGGRMHTRDLEVCEAEAERAVELAVDHLHAHVHLHIYAGSSHMDVHINAQMPPKCLR